MESTPVHVPQQGTSELASEPHGGGGANCTDTAPAWQFPASADPPLMARLLNPDTDPTSPFPAGALSNGILDYSLLSKSPMTLLAFIALGDSRTKAAIHEQGSITGTLHNARYRNQSHQLPNHAPLLRAHLLESLELLAAPIVESENILKQMGATQ